jgi:hypothetical protein
MRPVLLILFTICIVKANAQSFVNFKDTVNHFSIDIPAGWKYGPPQTPGGIKLIAIRGPLKEGEMARDNFNINIIDKLQSQDLEKNFASFERSISTRPNFKELDKGDTTINGQQFKWLIATHINKIKTDIEVLSYNFVTLKDGKAYLLTMATWPSYFDTIKPMFDKIAGSFILSNP